MKHLTIASLLLALLTGLAGVACKSSDNIDYDDYREWMDINNSWLAEQGRLKNSDGTAFYDTIRPVYDKGNYVLVHWFNDTTLTSGNLMPYYTSTVDVKYQGRLYNDSVFDSSYTMTTYGDSIARFKVSGVISGWTMALQAMHVGDSVRIVIPYQSGYGLTGSGSAIPPFSVLQFDVKLVDIPYWEKR